jgi:ketosteroid isomerase-like protein
MSEENVEVVRRLYELFERRDLDAAIPELADPDIELRVPPLYPDIPDVFRGLEGIERWLSIVDDVWSVWRFEPERYFDAGSTVVVFTLLIAEQVSSGIHLEREVGHLWTVHGGRATSIRVYLNRDEALQAAGLEE